MKLSDLFEIEAQKAAINDPIVNEIVAANMWEVIHDQLEWIPDQMIWDYIRTFGVNPDDLDSDIEILCDNFENAREEVQFVQRTWNRDKVIKLAIQKEIAHMSKNSRFTEEQIKIALNL